MKSYFLFFLLLVAASAIAQVKVSKLPSSGKVVTQPKKLPSTSGTKKAPGTSKLSSRMPDKYVVDKGLAARISIGLQAPPMTVDGKKIFAKMIPVNSPLLVSPVKPKATGITQRTQLKNTTTNNGEHCQTYSVKISANSENFDVPYGTQASHIYPGAAYMYEEYYKNTVSPRSITVPRNPLYLQVSSSSGSGKYELLENPTQVNLNAAVGRLKASLPSVATNESTSINMVSLYDEADFFLKVNGGGGGFGFKADASFSIATNSKKSYFLIDAYQTFFTINAMLPEGADSGFFKDPAMNAKNGALFMASVSYGRRVMGVLETEFKNEQIAANFKASYSAGFAGGYAGLDMINGMNSQSTKVKLYFVGGEAASINVPNATEASVRAAINSFLSRTTSQNAVPIRFTFRNMAMSGMRYESATENFTYQQCVPITPELLYDVNVNLFMIENSKQEEVKFGLSQDAKIYVNNNQVFINNPSTAPLLSWREVGEPFKTLWKSEPARSFTRTTTVNRSKSFRLKQSDILEGNARIDLYTDYIAMYATRVFGSTNDSNPKKLERVYIKDVITSGGNVMNKDVQLNFNGRVFTIKFVIKAVPVNQ